MNLPLIYINNEMKTLNKIAGITKIMTAFYLNYKLRGDYLRASLRLLSLNI